MYCVVQPQVVSGINRDESKTVFHVSFNSMVINKTHEVGCCYEELLSTSLAGIASIAVIAAAAIDEI